MPDIVIQVEFDYSNDAPPPNFTPSFPVQRIDPADKDFAKRCGWLSAWGKELTGIDLSKQGGNSFEGEWLFTRKHITFDGILPKSMTFNMDAMNFGDSPIVASVLIDNSTRMTAIITKLGNVIGSQDIAVRVQHASLPYPVDYAWSEHPQRPNGWSSVSKHAPHILKPDVSFVVQTSSDYVCHAVFVDQNGVVNSSSHPQSMMVANYGQYAQISTTNANTAAASVLQAAADAGSITFSKYLATSKISKKYSKSSKQPSAPIDSTFTASPASTMKFVKPDEITELPTPPKGFTWYANMRGVLFLESGGKTYWPHEVFDLAQMYSDLTAFNNQLIVEGVEDKREKLISYIERVNKQIECTRAVLSYMESVGDGISLNCKAFGDFK